MMNRRSFFGLIAAAFISPAIRKRTVINYRSGMILRLRKGQKYTSCSALMAVAWTETGGIQPVKSIGCIDASGTC
jgi:hypothetical protein